ncbi:hypothetical protein ACFV0T_26385 [Streptomyces sp. NPDC059582]|uniref:hypothetical protein n=1 Tax=Streptomyces sp. NPDC059582 TaxID=3346875 RepID=UPI00367BB184
MDTTTAAAEAQVTIATIRAWCRGGVIAATKQAGRWTIDAASLAHRIAIGQRKARVTQPSTYRLEEGTAVQYREERPTWTIVRTDGTPAGFAPGKDSRIWDATFFNRQSAEFYANFYENTPAGYSIEKTIPRAGRMDRTTYWVVKGSTPGDPNSLSQRIPADTDNALDSLIRWANQHAEDAPARIAKKAEQDAIEAAEAAVREARETQLAEARAQKGELATPRQVAYILTLLERRQHSGDGGGFFYGPTSQAGIEELSKREASTYIDSLTGNY